MLTPIWACSVCGAGTTVDQSAYLWMTIVISLLPLGMIGGLVFWVARRIRAQDRPAEVK